MKHRYILTNAVKAANPPKGICPPIHQSHNFYSYAMCRKVQREEIKYENTLKYFLETRKTNPDNGLYQI